MQQGMTPTKTDTFNRYFWRHRIQVSQN